MTYRKRIIIYFSVIIGVFTIGIILFEHQQVKNERTKSLENLLNNNADIIHNFMINNDVSVQDADTLGVFMQYFPETIRLTLIDNKGVVHYDNKMIGKSLENHITRPEIQEAIKYGQGSHIRVSESSHLKYLYFAKKYPEGYFIRLALLYDVQLRSFISAKNSFAFFILLFFIVCILMMVYFANKFSKSINELKEFSNSLKNNHPTKLDYIFPNDEVGEISANIVDNYQLLQENKKILAMEKEKLLQHFHYSEEGIAIFSKERKKIYANSHFLQFLNVIMDRPTPDIEEVFTYPEFEEFVQFIERENSKENMFTKRVEKSGKKFNIRVILFDDDSFELYISDITKAEKTRLLKQEMTNNIAHELRTPVTSMRGYLETLFNLNENDVERRNNFIERAYIQSIRLSELIQDISLLTKIEEASDRFEKEAVEIRGLLLDLQSDMEEKLNEKNILFTIDVADDIVVYGNRTLLYSIFRNLTENSLTYGGENIEIGIRCYVENEDAHYFEFYDTGNGVEEKHLTRIFERFYRVNEGRTRNTGGSGLGLSIVKNAILLHKGSIIAKKRHEGGLSFLITLPKFNKDNNQNRR